MNRQYRRFFWHLVMVTGICIQHVSLHSMSSLAKNDPYPIFTSLDPNEYLTTKERLYYKYPEYADLKNNHVQISISPFGQNAERGRTIKGDKYIPAQPDLNICCPEENDDPTCPVELGDLTGRWNMIALLYGCVPQGECYGPTLIRAREELFPGVCGPIDDPMYIDPTQFLGHFSVPIKYRKRGLRCKFDILIPCLCGFGATFKTGVACIRQNACFTDKNCDAVPKCPTCPTDATAQSVTTECSNEYQSFKEKTQIYLMDERKNVFEEICLDICDFSKVSIEEVRFSLWWRKLFEVNRENYDYPFFMFMPYIEFGGSVSPGKIAQPFEQFAVPFGNNGHTAVGMRGGLDFDFIQTIEFSFEASVTHFFGRDFCCAPVPTHPCQTTIFPFQTDINVNPGLNWHFGLKMSVFQFLDHLSMYFQYLIVEHKPDTICLKRFDPAFLPKQLEKLSTFKVNLANVAFNYDISPNMGLGFLWQAPLSQCNAYKTTTLLLCYYATF